MPFMCFAFTPAHARWKLSRAICVSVGFYSFSLGCINLLSSVLGPRMLSIF